MLRYRFGEFVVSQRCRMLLRDGQEQPLIPRYFDLLVYLVAHRREAVSRQQIFDSVWTDVIVSDSALSQAIRTLRRTLGDNSREPLYIRTVARHGYQFVHPSIVEEEDDGELTAAAVGGSPVVAPREIGPPLVETVAVLPHATVDEDAFEPLLERLTQSAGGDEEALREAAELLHGLGTREALRRLGTRAGHVQGRAVLRDTRWDVASAGSVPLLGAPAPVAVAASLAALRLRRAARTTAARWAGASIGAGTSGAIAGGLGGLILVAAPETAATLAIVPVLAVVGALAGGIGGAGVSAGLSLAEAIARSQRALASIAGGAAGGAFVGCVVQYLARWTLAALVGMHLDVGGCVEGAAIGAAAGLGYALATHPPEGGFAAPRGSRRLGAAAITAAACGLCAFLLSLTGHLLVGGTIHSIAQAASGSQAVLTPLGRIIGEPGFGPATQALIATGEGLFFGFGLALGLTRRPHSRTSQRTLTTS